MSRDLITDEYMQLTRDLFQTWWHLLLPWQGQEIIDAVALVTVHEIDGDLDTVLRLHSPNDPVSPSDQLEWETDTIFGEDALEEDDPEQRELDEQRRELFERVLADAARPIPTTVRKLAELLVDVGVLTHETIPVNQQKWRIAPVVPLPADALPLPPEWIQKNERLRRHIEAEPAVSALLSYFEEHDHTTLLTTIDRLGNECGYNADQIRAGLVSLVEDGDLRVDRRSSSGDLNAVDTTAIASHARILITVNWDHINSHRTAFLLTMPTAG